MDTELFKVVSSETIIKLILSGQFKHGAGLAVWLKYTLGFGVEK